jgi:hypothetical protein
LDTYMVAAGIAAAKGAPLFRTALGKAGVLSERRLGEAPGP